jgi:multimeric flavodoxin WrbA
VTRKRLLIVHHSQSGKTAALAGAVARGARHEDVDGVDLRACRALASGPADLLWADAVVVATPENFGAISGGMKDFLDRSYYPCEGKVAGMPVAIVISAGNDGSGALRGLRRIFNGLGLREVREPLIAVGPPTAQQLADCEALGMAMAAGLELGVF